MQLSSFLKMGAKVILGVIFTGIASWVASISANVGHLQTKIAALEKSEQFSTETRKELLDEIKIIQNDIKELLKRPDQRKYR
jgi:parvulin-like peptidyl-prolyl isomerase